MKKGRIKAGFRGLTGWFKKKQTFWWAAVISVYTLVVILWSCFFACRTWPGNRHAFKKFVREHDAVLITQVTDSSLIKVRQGEIALSRWEIQGIKNLTGLDRQAISNAIILALDLNQTNSNASPATNTTKPNPLSLLLTNLVVIDNTETCTVAPEPKAATAANGGLSRLVVLPTSGDLSTVPKSLLETNLAKLEEAAGHLRQRLSSLAPTGQKTQKSWWGGCPKPVACNPPLTPLERGEYQARLLQAATKEGVYLTSSKMFDLMLLIVSVGALGACGRILPSLAKFYGSGSFKPRWTWYYLFLPVQAAILVIGYFLIISGGIWSLPSSTANTSTVAAAEQSTNAPPANISLSSTNAAALTLQPGSNLAPKDLSSILASCALAFLIGMFSDEATKKLAKIAAAIFTDNTGKDALDDTAPVITNTLAVPLFSPATITNLETLGNKLKNPAKDDQLSQFIMGDAKFSAAAAAIKGTNPINNDNTALKQMMVDGLNQLIQSGPIYDENRFPNAGKDDLISELLAEEPAGAKLALLNWLLVLSGCADSMTKQTTRWLIELEGDNFLPGATVRVDKGPPTAVSNVTLVDKNTLRFEYKNADTLQKQAVVKLSVTIPATAGATPTPAPVRSEPAEATLDPAIWKS